MKKFVILFVVICLLSMTTFVAYAGGEPNDDPGMNKNQNQYLNDPGMNQSNPGYSDPGPGNDNCPIWKNCYHKGVE